MPLKKKNHNNTIIKVLVTILIVALIALMIISFAPAPNVTEIVLYP